MSWDIFVQDFPPGAKRIKDIPDDFKPRKVIAKRSEVLRVILELAPQADFTDPTWGRIDGDGFSIEVSIDEEEDLGGFAFFVRGVNPDVITLIADILDRLKLRATTTSGFFRRGSSIRSFERWQAYRNQVIDGAVPQRQPSPNKARLGSNRK